MAFFEACKGCDGRFPGCHSQCEKYKRDKDEYEKCMENERKKRDTKQGLRDQRTAAVGKAMRSHRRWK